ncbi:branched-chain amino acid ABC transporter substrate-binding protein [Plantactinospora sp. GCM10030261]|uniref:branched-chain amino acid ABC transporter substrate-binding protein n=1 Tax=Plantactinospora sp. GCM10030261 TaxID=3273420 RepID=UPI0036126BAE
MRQKLVRVVGGLALASALVVGAAGCGGGDEGGSASGDKCGLKLAFFGALTGDAANLGINIKNGAKLAVEEYNEKNADCKVELLEKDSQGDEKQAVGLAREIVKDTKIIGVIGPAFSGETEAAAPVWEEAQLPMISPSATRTDLSTKGWKMFHRGLGNDASQGPAAAAYIKDTLKAQKVYVIDDQSAYGAGLSKNVVDSLGPLKVGEDKVERNVTKDFNPVITKIKSSGADAVFYGGYYQEASILVKQMRAAGVTATMVAADGVKDPGYVEAAGNENAEGTILTCPCAPTTEAKGNFAENYKKKWGQDSGTYSDIAYDIAGIFLKGLDEGNTSKDKMLEFINGVTYEGVANTYKFTDVGELDPQYLKIWAYKVANGEIASDQEIKTQ